MSDRQFKQRTRRSGSQNAVLLAITSMLVGGFAGSLLHVGVRTVGPYLPTIEIAFLRTFFTALVALPFVLRPGLSGWRSSRFGLHLIRGIIGVVSICFWYYALSVIPLADAATLSFTTIIFVTIGAAVWFKERVGIYRWSAVAVGLIGTLIVLRPGAGVVTIAALSAVIGNVLWAISLLIAKELAKTDSSATIVFWQPLVILPFAFIGSVPVWVWPEPWVWGAVAGMGLMALIGNWGVINAMKLADVSIVMPVDYIRLIWMAGWGYFFFQELPDAATWTGAALIVASTLFITWREQQLAARREREGRRA